METDRLRYLARLSRIGLFTAAAGFLGILLCALLGAADKLLAVAVSLTLIGGGLWSYADGTLMWTTGRVRLLFILFQRQAQGPLVRTAGLGHRLLGALMMLIGGLTLLAWLAG